MFFFTFWKYHSHRGWKPGPSSPQRVILTTLSRPPLTTAVDNLTMVNCVTQHHQVCWYWPLLASETAAVSVRIPYSVFSNLVCSLCRVHYKLIGMVDLVILLCATYLHTSTSCYHICEFYFPTPPCQFYYFLLFALWWYISSLISFVYLSELLHFTRRSTWFSFARFILSVTEALADNIPITAMLHASCKTMQETGPWHFNPFLSYTGPTLLITPTFQVHYLKICISLYRSTEKMAHVVKFLNRIREVSGLNLGRDGHYCDWGFRGLLRSLHGKKGIIHYIWPWSLPCISFSIHYALSSGHQTPHSLSVVKKLQKSQCFRFFSLKHLLMNRMLHT